MIRLYSVFVASAAFTCFSYGATHDASHYSVEFDATNLEQPRESTPKGGLNLMIGYATNKAMGFKETAAKRGAAEASIYQRVSAGTVLIATESGIGSGAVITDTGYILTNQHVVGDSKVVRVFYKPIGTGNDVSKAALAIGTVVKVNWTTDLALVRVDSLPSYVRPIPLKRDAPPNIGEDAHAVGHPKGEVWSYTRGYVSQYRTNYTWSTEGESAGRAADVVQTQTPINPGNSGGPLVNADGALIGLNSFGDPRSPGLNFAVASSTIVKFLQQEGSVTAPAKLQKKKCGEEPLGEKRIKLKGGHATSIFFDPGCIGRATAQRIVPDDKTLGIIVIFHDPEGVEKSRVMVVDNDRDGQFDVTFFDSDGDGTWDMVGVNKPGEVFADDLKPYSGG